MHTNVISEIRGSLSDEGKTKQGVFKILNTLVEKGVLNEYVANDNKTKLYDVVYELGSVDL